MDKEDVRFYNPSEDITLTQHRLPHWHQEQTCCFVTWRLADSLPREFWDSLKEKQAIWVQSHPEPWDEQTDCLYYDLFYHQVDTQLDQGYGACALKCPHVREIVEKSLHYFDGKRYTIINFVIMPNHVHVLFCPLSGHSIQAIVKSWKGFSACKINAHLGCSGAFWQAEFWDRLIRNKKHFYQTQNYIYNNPASAFLKSGTYTVY